MTKVRVIGMTLCSGIGAPEVAAPWIDWRLASEIEPFPRAVLQQRFGYRDARQSESRGKPVLWGDFTALRVRHMLRLGIPLPDLIVAGTPCQAFSIAGLRKGLKDARGNLTLKFVETVHAIVAARPDGKLAVLWENVPGILSEKSNPFGCFLAGLVGAERAFVINGSWPGAGMVSGPRGRAAWIVRDAQYFGLAQRRRRVFVVVDFGNVLDPAEVLFERASLSGHSPPSREKGEETAGTLEDRAKGGGGLGADFEVAGGLQVQGHHGDMAGTVSAKWVKGSGGPAGDETQNMVATCATGEKTHALTSEGHDASEDGTGRGTPVVAFDCKGTEVQHDTIAPPLRAMGHNKSRQDGGGHAAVAFDLRGRDGGAQFEGPHDTANIRAASGGSSRSYVTTPQVRRLTPTECHRLQGFKDNHCAITYRGKPAADGNIYKALGNSMAVPVISWILNRMREAMQ